jgi:hypothetical protein
MWHTAKEHLEPAALVRLGGHAARWERLRGRGLVGWKIRFKEAPCGGLQKRGAGFRKKVVKIG